MIIVLAVSAVVAIATQVGFQWALDLRDLPGAASGTILLSVAEQYVFGGSSSGGELDRLFAQAARWMPGETATALSWLMSLCAVAAAMGAGLAGLALGTRQTGLAAGVVGALWSQSAWLGWMICYDTVALGLVWFGVGLALYAASRGKAWLALLIPALALVHAGVLAKEVAHPALAWLAAVPVVALAGAPKTWPWRLGSGLGALVAVAVAVVGTQLRVMDAHSAHDPVSPRHTVSEPDVLVGAVWQGVLDCVGVLSGPGWLNLVVVLGAMALVGAVVPGRHHAGRAVLALIGVLALGVMGAVATEIWLRLRYFGVPMFPLVVLAGYPLGRLADLAPRLWPPLRWAPVPLLGLFLLHDTIRFANVWHDQRTDMLELEASRLPEVPGFAWNVNDLRVRSRPSDTTLFAAIELRELLASEPDITGVAAPVMRDGRHRHALAFAAVDQGAFGIPLEARRCCTNGYANSACAAQVLDEIDASGVTLILPIRSPGDARIDMGQVGLYEGLVSLTSASERAVRSERWLLYTGAETGGPLPCGQKLPKAKGPRKTKTGPVGPPAGPGPGVPGGERGPGPHPDEPG